MKAFIAGATGVLGKRLVTQFTEEGHEVIGLTRDDEGDRIVRERGGEPRHGDILDRDSLHDAVGSPDVVVHAATAIPVKVKVKKEDWRQNDRIRREGTKNLTRAAAEAGASRYLQQSITWVARNPDGSRFDEESEPNTDYVTESAHDGEKIAREAGEKHGFSVGVLRCGSFYSHDSGHTRLFGKRLLDGSLPVIGGGPLGRRDARASFIHVDDAANAFVTAAESPAPGLWHVVDDEPTTYAEFLRILAGHLNAPEPRRVPAWLARFFVGKYNASFFMTSIPTTNERFKQEFGWAPRYPTVQEGLEIVVEQWLEEHTLERVDGGYRWNNKA